ncbi:MAG: TonB-dependent receptor, partial [Kordiimonadaceae bacterium]|nr:TonB-dependent receptor [Kordiimonadaceae bacterium]
MTHKKEFNRSMHTSFYRKFLNSVATSALLLPMSIASVSAQENADDAAFEFEEIVVTGTNIRGAKVVGGAVLTIGKDTLDKSGRSTAADFLRELPSNLAGGVGIADEVQSGQDAGPANANLAGGQGVNLRGLGALSTLVLVNGRRMATSGQFGDFVDIANIPTAAIERMEILQDGASAIYGSDAVGGVVNFILRRQLDGAITSARAGTTTEGGGTELSLSHVQGLNWDTGHGILGFEYRHRDSVKATSRDRYANGSDFSSFGGVNWRSFNYHMSPLTNIFLSGQGGGAAAVGATVPSGSNGSLTNADLITVTDGIGNTANVYDQVDILPEVETISLFGSFDQDIGDNVTLFGDFRYTDRTSNYDLGYSQFAAHTLSPDSPFYIADIDPSLTNADGSIPFGTLVTDRPDTREASVERYSGQIGLRVDIFSDWSAEVVASYARDKQRRYREQLRNVNGSTDFMVCALGYTTGACATADAIPFNPFSTDPLTDAQLDQYFGFEDLTFDSKVMQLSAKADGTIFTLPAGDVKLAIGVDYREEAIDGFLDFNTLSVDTQSGPYEETKRNAVSFFGEAYIPVTEKIEVSLAGRYETFSGTGDYSTFDPKVGINFRPTDGLRLHGSWGTSFHAPAMRFENDSPQPLPGGNAAFRLNVGRFGPCDSDLIDFNGIVGTPGAAGEQCTFSYIINSGGAGEGVLRPESAETWTVGFDFEPETVPGLRLSASYFNIKVDDRIQRIQAGTLNGILEEFFATGGGGAFREALTVNPSTDQVQAFFDNPKFIGTFGPGS